MWNSLTDYHTKRNSGGGSKWERDSDRSSSKSSANRNSGSSESKDGSNRSSKSDYTEPDSSLEEPEPLYTFYVDSDTLNRDPDDNCVTQDEGSIVDSCANRIEEEEEKDEASSDENTPTSEKDQNSAMRFVRSRSKNGNGRRSFWCEVPAVIQSGILEMLNRDQVKLQEIMFEVIVSEASYLKRLRVLKNHFMKSPLFDKNSTTSSPSERIIDVQEWKELFKDVCPVIEVSERFLLALDARWRESVVINDICDILRDHADNYFGIYVTYCSNQHFQNRCLTKLKEDRPHFLEALEKLESDPICRSQSLQSFLVLPVQRIMRLRLLIEALRKQLGPSCRSEDLYKNSKAALKSLQVLCEKCNEKTKEIQRHEETLVIINLLEFADVKRLTLASQSRFLLRKTEATRWISADTEVPISWNKVARWMPQNVWLFLFTDLLLVAKKKSATDTNYVVVDYCSRNLVLVVDDVQQFPAKLPDCCSSLDENVGLCLLKNCKSKISEFIVSFSSGAEKKSFVDTLLPEKCPRSGKRFYAHGDYPLMECLHEYSAQRADELSLKESDIVKIHCKACDGWFKGERLQDGVQGWFPSNFARETVSEHLQAKNLRQRHHVSIIAQRHIEEQKKVDQRKSTFFVN